MSLERKTKEQWDEIFAGIKALEDGFLEPAGFLIKKLRYSNLGYPYNAKERKRDYKLDSWDRMWYGSVIALKISRGRIGKWVDYSEGKEAAKIVEEATALLPATEYSRFAGEFRRLINAKGLDKSWSVYPTEYGIGIWIYYNWNSERDCRLVKELMDESGVEYSNEYSNAAWVYRFRLAKGEKNLDRIREVIESYQNQQVKEAV